MNRYRSRITVSMVSIACLGVASATAGPIEVIYCKHPASPKSIVPGARDLAGQPITTKFRALEDFAISPDGTQWVVKGRCQAGSDLETLMILGSGATGDMFAQEGQPFSGGVAGELYDFFDSLRPAAFNDSGNIAFTARAKGGLSSVFEKVVVYDGITHTIVIQRGDAALGLIDQPPNPSGDEIFGNSMSGIQLRNDGTVGFFVTPIGNCHSSRYPALFYGNTAFRQSGASAIGGETWDSFDSGDFGGTPDGAHWYAQGDTENANTAIDDILAVDDVIVLREGSPVAGSAVILAAVFQTKMVANGDWFSRGDDPANNDWAVRNGVLIAKTGDAIGATSEHLGNAFGAFAGNQNGDWLLTSNTDNPDPATDHVMLLNGEVIVREGDPVDLDGNGLFDDDAFIGRGNLTSSAFAPSDLYLTDDGTIYFIANLRDGAGNDLNSDPSFGTPDAFMRIVLNPCDPCDADCDGSVTTADIGDFVSALLGSPSGCSSCQADTNGDGDLDGADVVDFVVCLLGG